ncbi:hypothetical protein HDV03_003070 [Kappamyces sp. JEL0829]|nr:hypothetical protein HDV03_003070 [Kappamyces sp. JEL0829]
MKVVLVTGCSNGGIGSSLAKEFLGNGCFVYATGRKASALSDLEGAENCQTLLLDVNNASDCQAAVDTIMKNHGRIDILVCNAGMPCVGAVLDQSLDRIRNVFETNVFSVIALAKLVAPIMAKQDSRGRILNVGSIVSDISTPWAGIYCASKAAVQSITDVMRQELGPFGIEVCLIQPGAITSNIGNAGMASLELPEEGSLFSPFKDQIVKRAGTSQSKKSTPTAVFAAKVVGTALSKGRLPIRLRYGHLTMMFWTLTFFPLRLAHLVLARLFGLNRTITHGAS